jgi:tRNA threonylcarbamoyladenosine biosynthesis protein TsaB
VTGSIGLYHAGKITVRLLPDQRKHSDVILNEIASLLSDHNRSLNDLSAIAFTNGPGSFTGLRIACSVVQAIAFSKNIPVIAINTLEAIAQKAQESHAIDHVLPVMDARMGEIFIAAYQKINDAWQAVLEPVLTKMPALSQLALPDSLLWTATGLGPLVNEVADFFQISAQNDLVLTAEAVLTLAKQKFDKHQFLSADEAQPFYLRNKVALTMPEQRMR